jgi:hypothetical protein
MRTKKQKNDTKKEAYIDEIAAQLKAWSAKIDELESRTRGTAAGVKSDYEHFIRSLKLKRDLLSVRLRDMRDTGSGAWTALKTGVEAANNELKDAFAEARDKFRKAA